MKKRILACFMAVCMLVCLSVTASAADATYTDLTGYEWAEEAIYRWTEAGIVDGKGNNTFDPAGLLKRSEAAKIFANLLKLTEKSDKVFVDVPGTEWFADYVALVNKAGIMNGMSETTFEPATPVSREMVFTMVCRALGIEGQETLNGTFEDAAQISEWAKKSVNALVNLGYVNGRTATTLAPQENMTRAEMMALLNKVIGVYATEAGVVVKVEGKGVALVVADDVKLEGEFEGTVVVAAESEVDMAGVTGAAKVVATVGKVSVVNAPVGTTVTAANGATGVTVNNTKVEADDSETVTEPVVTPDPVDPTPTPDPDPEEPKPEPEKPSIIVHVHTYKNWACNNDGTHTGTCECGETKTEACDAEVLEAVEATCVTGGLTEGNTGCETCGVEAVAQKETLATGHDFGTCGHDKEDALKFQLIAESGTTVGEKAVTATVYDDYSAVVVIPTGTTVDASEVTVTAKMQNVGSLGVSSMREHSLTVGTGVDGYSSVALDNQLSSVFAFENAVLDVTIGKADSFVYTVTGEGDGTIVATPDSVDGARAAWMELTSYVSTGTSTDSSIVVKKGSYITVGGQTLCFEEGAGDLVIDNVNELSELKQHIKDTVKVVDLEEDNLALEIFIAEGTTLAVGSSSATLDADCTIVIEEINYCDDLTGILGDLRTAGNSSTTQLIKDLVGMLNKVVTSINNMGGDTIYVTVSFN